MNRQMGQSLLFSVLTLGCWTSVLEPSFAVAPFLSDQEIISIGGKYIDGRDTYRVQTGVVSVMVTGLGGNDPVDAARVWEQIGAVQVTKRVDQNLPAILSMATNLAGGSTGQLQITPLPRLTKAALSHDQHGYVIKAATDTIERVVKTSQVEQGTDDYVVALVQLQSVLSPLFKAYIVASGGDPSTHEYREKLLFKYDPFSLKWSVVAKDQTPLSSDDFTTNVVNQYLASH